MPMQQLEARKCEDARSCAAELAHSAAVRCQSPTVRAKCPKACNACSALTVPLHVATLLDGKLPIPREAAPLLLEIGSSDRNTMDEELLRAPEYARQLIGAFLVTCEPLLEKYARALGRRAPADSVRDAVEPLGQHHPRGIILPLAIAPDLAAPPMSPPLPPSVKSGTEPSMPSSWLREQRPRTLHLSGNAGCSSLLTPENWWKRRRRSERDPSGGKAYGDWCSHISQRRNVWSVSLEQLLRWVDLEVSLLKIDAQGMDLDVVRSGGPLLSRVLRVAMEVVADDCRPIYLGQPRCSHVMTTMRRLGFVPASHTPCTPPFPRRKANHLCELEVLFVQARRFSPPAAPTRPSSSSLASPLASPPPINSTEAATRLLADHGPFLMYHNINSHGCDPDLVYNASTAPRIMRSPPPGRVVVGNGAREPGFRAAKGLPWAYPPLVRRGNLTTATAFTSPHARGVYPYICPRLCKEASPEESRYVNRRGGACPFGY